MSAKGKRKSEKRSKSGKRVKTKKGHKGNKDETSVRRDIITQLLEEAKANKEVLKYITFFFPSCFVFYLIYYFLTVSNSRMMVHLRNITALILGTFFSLSEADVVVNGAMVSVNGFINRL